MSFNPRVGQRVELIDKKVQGKIAYVGTTAFAQGKWIGVVLDESKGKNNGSVQGRSYFSCPENHGIFVRQNQIKLLDGPSSGKKSASPAPSSGAATPRSSSSLGPSPAITPAASETSIPQLKTTKVLSPAQALEAVVGAGATSGIRPPTRTVTSESISSSLMTGSALSPQTPTAPTPMHQSLHQPRQSIDPSSNEDSEKLRAQVKDLEEKLETLRLKRATDKAKIKELEKNSIQLQQLQEYKRQITEVQASLQKELAQAKKEAKEAIEERERHAEEMRDLAETAEIATLDKEMAEEKLDQVTRELQESKEKLEEATLELEILKNEIEEKGGMENVAADAHSKQLESQNERLKEALLKMRDLSAQDKIEIQKLQKEMDKYKNDCLDLQKRNEKLSTEIASYENQIAELKEQIDIALGAQEMVEMLTEKNLDFEEKIAQMQEEIDDLEKLHDMDQQLAENAKEEELELREELDLMRNKLHEAKLKYDNVQDTLADYEQTISKFRDLVNNLRAENQQLRNLAASDQQKQQQEMIQQQASQNVEFKIRFAESKALARQIDLELRRLEVTLCHQHIQYLFKFMPEEFFAQGGDHDAIKVLLFVPRIMTKCELIAKQIAEKYPPLEDPKALSSELIIKGSEQVHQQTFVYRIIFSLVSINTILHQHLDALRVCPVELLLKVGSLFDELCVHERNIDSYIELLKKNSLDETCALDLLDRALSYFQSLFNIHLSDGRINDCHTFLSNVALLLKAGVDASLLDAHILNCLKKEEEHPNLKAIMMYLSEIHSMSKKLKRKLAGDQKLQLSVSMENELRDCVSLMNRVVGAMNTARRTAMESTAGKQGENALLDAKSLEKVIAPVGGFKFLEESLSGITAIISQLTSGLQQGDYDLVETSPTSAQDKPNPLEYRAEIMKKQAIQMKEMKAKLDSRESELSELKRALKAKIEELSEMQIRRDLAEKKLALANKDADDRVVKVQQELDDLRADYQRKEKEFEDTLNHLQADIESLEQEKQNLKEKVKLLSKKTVFEGLTKSMSGASPVSSPSPHTVSGPGASPSHHVGAGASSSFEASLLTTISSLRLALKRALDRNDELQIKLAGDLMMKKASLRPRVVKPLWLLKLKPELAPSQQIDEELMTLGCKIQTLQNEMRMMMACNKIYDFNKPLKNQIEEEFVKRKELESKYNELVGQAVDAMKRYHPDLQITGAFANFQPPHVSKALQQTSPELMARIKIPCNTSERIPLNVSLDNLRSLHQKLIC